ITYRRQARPSPASFGGWTRTNSPLRRLSFYSWSETGSSSGPIVHGRLRYIWCGSRTGPGGHAATSEG
ncbi:MAG: hypothetical protein ACK56F_06195, partial [bacterium]